jgi:hypothetical protein
MNKMFCVKSFLFFGLSFFAGLGMAAEMAVSGKNEIFDNPFIAVGYNPATKLITGYVLGLRAAPGQTDACQLIFEGVAESKDSVEVSIRDADDLSVGKGKTAAARLGRAIFSVKGGKRQLIIKNDALPGNCDFVLPFTNDGKVNVGEKETRISMDGLDKGDWIMVRVVRAKRAYFHKQPNQGSIDKAFLVAGDVMYIYETKPDWYYVKFKGAKKETVGWVKKQDVLSGSND